MIKSIAGKVNSPIHELEKKVETLLAQHKKLEKEVEIAMQRNASNAASELLGSAHTVNDIPLITHNLGCAQFFHLAGRMPEGDPVEAARAALDHYQLIGTQSDIPGFLDRLLKLLDVSSPVPVVSLLSPARANASLHRFEVEAADRAYIEEHARFEQALFEEARRRS